MLIDLGEYRSPGTNVYSGRPRGEAVRTELNLDAFDAQTNTATVKVPEETFSINTSFFLGLFGPSVRRAGSKEAFLIKFSFVCTDEIRSDIDDGIDRAFKEESTRTR